jgi:hypothetical protein
LVGRRRMASSRPTRSLLSAVAPDAGRVLADTLRDARSQALDPRWPVLGVIHLTLRWTGNV